MSKKYLDNVILTAIVGHERYLEKTIKAVEYSYKEIDFKDVQILSSVDFKHERINCVKIKPINSSQEYSDFCINDLNKFINHDFMFLIQYDGFIINGNKWKDEFLDYDFIGAPWPASWCLNDTYPPISCSTRVGNGGCCIRSKKLLDLTPAVCDINLIRSPIEDALICRHYKFRLEKLGCKFPSVDLAADFSIEHEIEERPGMDNYKGNLQSMCFHGAWSVYRRLLDC